MDVKPAVQARVHHPALGAAWVTKVDVPGNDDVVFIKVDGYGSSQQVLWSELEYEPIAPLEEVLDDVESDSEPGFVDEAFVEDAVPAEVIASLVNVGRTAVDMFNCDRVYWATRWPTQLVAAVTEHIQEFE